MASIDDFLATIPSYATELGLNLYNQDDRFKWFLAAFLFAKRISVEIAKKTIRLFISEGLVTPETLLKAGWHKLVDILDKGGYVRYDYSTASNLLLLAENLLNTYGSLENLYNCASDSKDLEARLMEFKGIGPVCVNIFLRELRGVWEKAQPAPSPIAVKTAVMLGLKDFIKYESALVRLNLEYCKRGKCAQCPVKEYCKNRKTV
ncbi:MAG: hypothetical protein OdinLCB4_002945 [Candidatus Odinarchaeum yellowstonii]|uniref:Uncharacterized protein n=1 Tax=Odinarchaeota yellowstonii (strain LCB_4) TaxID=1841599 RepID=A0AAF0IBY8_ODILC|nr:MAG: hypothetical protein OdinLCB4_002945 [Candidatus Odinarchaeum yellowstonii]